MQSAGHAAAQSEQPTHFSSPFSWRWSRCRPRKRGYTGRLYSGYCCVIGLPKSCRNVTANPRRVSIACGITRCSSNEDHQEGRDERVDRGDGEQDLPAEAHQLVVAQARQRGTDPDEERDEDPELEREP